MMVNISSLIHQKTVVGNDLLIRFDLGTLAALQAFADLFAVEAGDVGEQLKVEACL